MPIIHELSNDVEDALTSATTGAVECIKEDAKQAMKAPSFHLLAEFNLGCQGIFLAGFLCGGLLAYRYMKSGKEGKFQKAFLLSTKSQFFYLPYTGKNADEKETDGKEKGKSNSKA